MKDKPVIIAELNPAPTLDDFSHSLNEQLDYHLNEALEFIPYLEKQSNDWYRDSNLDELLVHLRNLQEIEATKSKLLEFSINNDFRTSAKG
tara:strand:- start:1146 stop:1418 length:273 start_codon:yes stop_codon:yes gene_type:complete